jgi:hypothetical protein
MEAIAVLKTGPLDVAKFEQTSSSRGRLIEQTRVFTNG